MLNVSTTTQHSNVTRRYQNECGLFLLMLLLPALFSLFALGTTILLAYRMWTRERPLMKKAQNSAFKLYDQVFQSLVPKGLNDKFLEEEESKSKEA